MPKINCPSCGQPIEYPEELADTESVCPQCDSAIRLSDSTLPTIRVVRPRATPPEPRETINETPVMGLANRLVVNIEKVLVGKHQEIVLLLAAYFARGHVLLEDVPGVAKTMLARSLASSIAGSFKRIQCTPDLLPNDITGTSVFHPKTTEFEFRPGPLFAQIVLADEINRATPRAQSALLEAMAEGRVTADGTDYELKSPFFLIATQNPIDHEGTFPLPEAQLDRFLIRLSLGYPEAKEEAGMLERLSREHPITDLEAVASSEEIIACQEAIRQVQVDSKIAEYVVNLMRATREHGELRLGGSPRASLALIDCARSYAAIHGYDFVMPDDIKLLAPYVLGHRLLLKMGTRLRNRTAEIVIKELLREVPVPTMLPGGLRS